MVFDAKGTNSRNRRVFEIQSGGTAELIGLGITGGVVLGMRFEEGAGAGVYVNDNGVANFEGCNIHNNRAFYGGGVYLEGVANFVGCKIHDNSAATDYGREGGGLNIYGGTATLTNTYVHSNQGGGVKSSAVPLGVVNFEGCYIHDNAATVCLRRYLWRRVVDWWHRNADQHPRVFEHRK